MLDLDPCSAPYALALLEAMTIDQETFLRVRELVGDVVMSQRHRDYAALIQRQLQGKPLDGYHTLLIGTFEAHEVHRAHAARVWLNAALAALHLLYRVSPSPWRQ